MATLQLDKHPLTIVVQTVRLPDGRDQFVVPSGCTIKRGQLLSDLDQTPVDASHHVVQPGTGREGVERLVVLGAQRLTTAQAENLREWLQSLLKSVPDIIDEVTQHSISGELPASTVLATWQDEMQTRFPVSAIGRTNSASSVSNYWSLLIMSGLVLSAGVLWMMAPPISDFFSIDGSVNNGSANNHTGDDDIPKLISNYWNLTNDESDIDEVDLLKILDPLVASTPNHSDRERLSHVFQSINKVRLGTGADTNKSDPESDDKVLRRLLNDGALNSYIRKLISINGAYDRFGQVANNIELVALKQLLPVLIIEKTAFNYRRLVRQLVSIDSIGPKGERLLDEEDPFFDFDDQYPNHYNRMVKFVPKSLSGASIDCTFFTEDDCIAAREITTYFRSIDYLDEQGLGFSSSDPRRKRLATNSTRLIARLLNDWKAFTNEKPDDPQPNQVTNGKLPVNEIP